MNKFNWEDSLSVGVDAMDDQHKVLINGINELMEVIDTASNEEILKRYSALGDFVVKHFTDEEAFMESIGYEGLASHKIIHEKLLAQLGDFAKEIEAGTLDSNKLFQFLQFWLKSHIMGIDTKYGEVAKKQSA